MSVDTSAGGWPDPERPGVPLHPERDGWHWLRHSHGFVSPYRWTTAADPRNGFWLYPPDWEVMPEDKVIARQAYLGPCFTPDEHRALLAERDALRAAATALDEALSGLWRGGPLADGHEDHLGPVDDAWRLLRDALKGTTPLPDVRIDLPNWSEALMTHALTALCAHLKLPPEALNALAGDRPKAVVVPLDALVWLYGASADGFERPERAHGHYWWRGEFLRRAGISNETVMAASPYAPTVNGGGDE